MAKPASNLVSGQFINIQKLHVAKLLTDTAGDTATYEEPIDLGKVLRSVDIKPSTSTADLYADASTKMPVSPLTRRISKVATNPSSNVLTTQKPSMMPSVPKWTTSESVEPPLSSSWLTLPSETPC